jgi:hypothetical protein
MPTLVFATLIATLAAAIAHVIVGGGVQRLIVFILVSWITFAFGHVVGTAFRVDALNVGTLRLLPALISAGIALMVTAALTVERRKRVKRTSG